MAEKHPYRGRAKDNPSDSFDPSEHNLDQLIEHAKFCWDAEVANASRAATERRVLATAVVALMGLGIANAKWMLTIENGGLLSWRNAFAGVSFIFFLLALYSILSIKVMPLGLSNQISEWVRCVFRRMRIVIGKEWEDSRWRDGWRIYLYDQIVAWSRRPEPSPPSASFQLRLTDDNDEMWELINGDGDQTKLVIFARIYTAFMDLQKRTSADLARIRQGTVRFVFGVLFAVIALTIILATTPKLDDNGVSDERPPNNTQDW